MSLLRESSGPTELVKKQKKNNAKFVSKDMRDMYWDNPLIHTHKCTHSYLQEFIHLNTQTYLYS